MGCQSDVVLGRNLTFSIKTHNPSTAALQDAASDPAYRIYEDETGTPILTGTMSKLDDAGTTGLYSELVACTAGSGFEQGKSYTIDIVATVAGTTGGISFNFRVHSVWAEETRGLTQSAVQVTSQVAGAVITLLRGDTLSASLTGLGSIANRSKLWFTVKYDVSDADLEAIIQIEESAGLVYINGAAGTSGNGSITVDDEDNGDITVALEEAETDDLPVGKFNYDVQVLTTGTVVTTLTTNKFTVVGDVTRAVA